MKFNTSNGKFQKMWEKSHDNKDRISTSIKKINVDFRSLNYLKKTNIVPIIENIDVSRSLYFAGTTYYVDLLNFPEWAINMIYPSVVFNLGEYNIINDVGDFSDRFNEGILKVDDFTITSYDYSYWIVKYGDAYRFTIKFHTSAYIVSNVYSYGWSSSLLPMYADVNLHITNERNYNDIQ